MSPQPRRKTDVSMLIANIQASLEELEALLPPDIPEDEDEDGEEPDSADLKAYRRKVDKLRRELRSLRRNR